MSNSRFIKFIPSQEADYLQENHPNAFLLLCLIAKRARRISGQPDGLEIGEAHIGDYKKAGIQTRQQYRTALEILEMRKTIKKVETCRTRKKSTTGTTTEGTKVKLLKSDIWDINSEDINQPINHRATTEQPPSNHEQERTRKNKNVEETITTPPNPQTYEIGVDACFSFLEEFDLSEENKKSLKEYPIDRVKLALEYSIFVKPKKDLISMLIWHCKKENPPLAEEQKKNRNESNMIENKKIAKEFLDQCKPLLNGKNYLFNHAFNSLRLIKSNNFEDISLFEEPSIFRNRVEAKLRDFELWKPLKNEKIETVDFIALEI